MLFGFDKVQLKGVLEQQYKLSSYVAEAVVAKLERRATYAHATFTIDVAGEDVGLGKWLQSVDGQSAVVAAREAEKKTAAAVEREKLLTDDGAFLRAMAGPPIKYSEDAVEGSAAHFVQSMFGSPGSDFSRAGRTEEERRDAATAAQRGMSLEAYRAEKKATRDFVDHMFGDGPPRHGDE